jgi:hypothetical protein
MRPISTRLAFSAVALTAGLALAVRPPGAAGSALCVVHSRQAQCVGMLAGRETSIRAEPVSLRMTPHAAHLEMNLWPLFPIFATPSLLEGDLTCRPLVAHVACSGTGLLEGRDSDEVVAISLGSAADGSTALLTLADGATSAAPSQAAPAATPVKHHRRHRRRR